MFWTAQDYRDPLALISRVQIRHISSTLYFHWSFHGHVQKKRRLVHIPKTSNILFLTYLTHVLEERTRFLLISLLPIGTDFANGGCADSWRYIVPTEESIQPASGSTEALFIDQLAHLALKVTAGYRVSKWPPLAKVVKKTLFLSGKVGCWSTTYLSSVGWIMSKLLFYILPMWLANLAILLCFAYLVKFTRISEQAGRCDWPSEILAFTLGYCVVSFNLLSHGWPGTSA